jgi:hypothetical protein
MSDKRKRRGRSANKKSGAPDKRESGEPGGGQGRRDEVGASGVYSPSAENIPPDAEIRMAGSWGSGDYDESGGSELVYRDEQLLGGLTSGPAGEPTIDIHARGERSPDARDHPAPAGSENDTDDTAAIDPVELRMRGLPKGSDDASDAQGNTHGDATRGE